MIAINTEDLLAAIGLRTVKRGRGLLAALCRPAAKRFSLEVLEFDRRVGCEGLAAAASATAQAMNVSLTVRGGEYLPRDGPLLLLSNHPGLTDTLLLFSSIVRPDLLTIAADRPFLRALPNLQSHLIYLNDAHSNTLQVLRQSVSHLRAGGALLTFPAGKIEPDPAIRNDAAESLAHWSNSIALLARRVPTLQIVPVLVAGVLNPHAQRHPLRLIRRQPRDREWLAAMLQLTWRPYRRVHATVRFGEPICGCTNATEQVHDAMRRMMRELPPATCNFTLSCSHLSA